MVDLALLQSVSYIAGALGVCVAAIYYVMNLRISQKNKELMLKAQQQAIENRNTQFLITLHNSMDNEGITMTWKDMIGKKEWSTFEEWWDKFGPENNIEYCARARLHQDICAL